MEGAFEHPLLTHLADFADGRIAEEMHGWVETHLGRCAECRAKLSQASVLIDLPDEVPDLPVVPSIGAWRSALFNDEQPDPEPGQLWRLRWEETAALAIVLRTDSEDVVVAPVGLDEWMADEYTIVVPSEWSPIEVGFGVWVSLESVVPLMVLDVCLGRVDVLDQVSVIRQAYRKGIEPPDHVLVGARIQGDLDERSQYRRRIALEMANLSDASWFQPQTVESGSRTLPELLQDIDPRRLGEALDLDAPSTFVLLRGERPLKSTEAERIADLIGVESAEVLAAVPPVPPELLREINHPRHRKAIEIRASEGGRSSNDERLATLHEVLGIAARRVGDVTAPLDWDRLLRDRFGR